MAKVLFVTHSTFAETTDNNPIVNMILGLNTPWETHMAENDGNVKVSFHYAAQDEVLLSQECYALSLEAQELGQRYFEQGSQVVFDELWSVPFFDVLVDNDCWQVVFFVNCEEDSEGIMANSVLVANITLN
jgi:hypothetical protein